MRITSISSGYSRSHATRARQPSPNIRVSRRSRVRSDRFGGRGRIVCERSIEAWTHTWPAIQITQYRKRRARIRRDGLCEIIRIGANAIHSRDRRRRDVRIAHGFKGPISRNGGTEPRWAINYSAQPWDTNWDVSPDWKRFAFIREPIVRGPQPHRRVTAIATIA